MLQCVVPRRNESELDELLKSIDGSASWRWAMDEDRVLVSVLIDSSQAERLSDALCDQFDAHEGFRLVLLPAEATVPKLPEHIPADPNGKEGEPPDSADLAPDRSERVSREELLEDIRQASGTGRVFVLLSGLSAVVAAIGLARDNVAIIIGAMVIAPLLGPNIALALGTTLADDGLIKRALRANAMGAGLAFAVALVMGALLTVDPSLREIDDRTRVSMGDVGLALASGAAGALVFTTGASTALVGVMVAVALMPPLVNVALLLGAGLVESAGGALLLLLVNIVCVNLAGVATFLLQGVRPQHWHKAELARRATRRAMIIWATLLAALIVLLLVAFD